jgi:gluconolactonase
MQYVTLDMHTKGYDARHRSISQQGVTVFWGKCRTIKAEVFAALPEEFRMKGKASARSAGSRAQHKETHSFLEGPVFDRAGNLYINDVPFGRIFRITPDGKFSLAAHYDGEPCGHKIHRDGTGYVTDQRLGLVRVDLAKGTVTPHLTRRYTEAFRGVNDLCFSREGEIYFTDQGLSDLRDPHGRIFRLAPDGTLSCLLENAPSPNGIVLSPDENTLYVAMTRANAIWRLPLMIDGSATKVGAFITLSGGVGPDGITVDEAGGLVVAHPGLGVVWVFDKRGEPTHRIESPVGDLVTNVAFGGKDNRTLFITESHSGTVLAADVDVPGQRLFSHA